MNSSSGEYGYFWLHRLHAFTGLIFAFAFVVLFLVPYSSIFAGDLAFNRFMAKAASLPLAGWAELLLIGIPLAVHAALGLLIIHGGQINVFAYGFYRNWMYALQRAAGVILVPFVVYHIYATKLVYAFTSRSIDANRMHAMLSSNWVLGIYVAGIVAAAFYVGQGCTRSLSACGIAASRQSRTAAEIGGWIVTIALASWGVRIILEF